MKHRHAPWKQMLADLLSPGIFDVSIKRSGYPYLEAEATHLDDIKLQQVRRGTAGGTLQYRAVQRALDDVDEGASH